MEDRVNICSLWGGQCCGCPLEHDCDIGFNVINSREYWIKEIQSKIDGLQVLMDRLEENNGKI